jgi:NAD-dependent SIR2 family protein deacetylase
LTEKFDSNIRVKLIVTCGRCEQQIGEWYDKIEEKYPFYCEVCEEYTNGITWPWKLKTEIEEYNEQSGT